MPTQYQLTDQAIHAAAAADGVILSKVPGHGTDKIGIRRIDSKGRPVLYDIEGTAIKTAFGVEKYHWENGEDMCGPIQKASFQNHGKDTASGSKPTYKNITVSGMPSYTAPEPKQSPLKPSPAKKMAGGAFAAGASSSSKRKFDRFTSDMTEGELAELQIHVRSAISAKKAAKKAADSSKKKMEAKLAKMREDKAKRLKKMDEEEAKLQAALEAMDSASPAKAVVASPAKAVAASPTKATGKATGKAAAAAADSQSEDMVMSEEVESGSESNSEEESGSESEEESGSEAEEESGSESEEEEEAEAEAEAEEDPSSDNSVLGDKFDGSKAVLAVHYKTITGKRPPVSWNRPQIRSALIKQHYSNDQLRLLGNHAGIDSRITTTDTLRTKLTEHYSIE